MRILFSLLVFLMSSYISIAQKQAAPTIQIVIINPAKEVLQNATVSLLKYADSSLIKTEITNSVGSVTFPETNDDKYILRISQVNYLLVTKQIDRNDRLLITDTIILQPVHTVLKDVTVTAKKPLIQMLPDKTIINVDAGITNAGTTVMEVLEKSPGVTVDKEGNISLKGKPNVTVMIDGRLTQLSGMELQNLLTGLSASQVEQIELMDNPPAKYDAAGNAGIINIKTKKNKQKGFNGSATIAYGQGRYQKNNNNLQLNYRNGSFNTFFNYSLNVNKGYTDLYALRTYFDKNGNSEALLEQPYYTTGGGPTQTIRTGLDYYLSTKTTIGISLNGLLLSRDYNGNSTAEWMNADHVKDSSIQTTSHSTANWKHGGININAKHSFSTSKELTADIDYLVYNMKGDQLFYNLANLAGSSEDGSKGDLPGRIHIFSAKADYSQQVGIIKWSSGWKSSHVTTDNLAQYYYLQNNQWKDDLGRSNHFLYTENIHAVYTNGEMSKGKWSLQAGLRYEYTGYDAKQLGNAVVKDSSFSRNYKSLFPTSFITYKMDSINSFTLSVGRRIDRPAFQSLNPFVYIINKYTLQQGNPYIRPQYTWNIELSHLYKDVLTTSVNYNSINSYFSQVFLADTATGTIIYTEGNVGKMQHYGLSMSTQLSPLAWWSFTAEADLTHKKIQGILWKDYRASITQFTFSMNNQVHFSKTWAGELSGFYISKSQNDLQEVLQPTGQLSLGISKQIFKNKGTIKLTARDMLYTQVMEGLTHFLDVNEYFKLRRDTRVCTLAFTYRFGKAIKNLSHRQTGASADEIDRVGNAN
ncbi:MAG: TonB-dependent receptor [Chitinophagaceae bacterium]